MTDIVERLHSRRENVRDDLTQGRKWVQDALCQEAADEIDRLRAALRRYGDRASMSFAPPELQPTIDAAFAKREEAGL